MNGEREGTDVHRHGSAKYSIVNEGGADVTPKQELRVMETIARNVQKLDQPGRNWLASWLVERELTAEIAEAEQRQLHRRILRAES